MGETAKMTDTQMLLIRDTEGRPRAFLGVLDDGSAGLFLTDKESKPRAGFIMSADGQPRLDMHYANGQTGACLTVKNDLSGLSISDTAGKTRAVLGMDPGMNPFLLLSDAAEKPRVGIRLDAGGFATLDFYDQQDKLRIRMNISTDDEPTLTFTNSAEQVGIGLNMDSDGSAVQILGDGKQPRIGLAVRPGSGPELSVMGADGSLLFRAP